jgi:hypothetical protein
MRVEPAIFVVGMVLAAALPQSAAEDAPTAVEAAGRSFR